MSLFNKLKFIKNRHKAVVNGSLLICTKRKKEESKYSSKKTYVFKYGVIDSKGNLVFDYKFDNIVAIGNKFLYFSVYDFSIYQRKISILNLEDNKYVAKDVYGGILKPSWNSDNNKIWEIFENFREIPSLQ